MIGPLPTAPGGFNRVLVAIDKFTKWIKVKPITCTKADRVLDFLDELVHRYGLPHRIITDLGSNFNNHQFWEYCENSGIDVWYVLADHPQDNGQVKRTNGPVLDALKKRLHDAANTKGGKWIKELPNALWGTSYSTYQDKRAVTILLGLRLQGYSICRRQVGFAGSRAIRRRQI
jgi:transposase InsO family protein